MVFGTTGAAVAAAASFAGPASAATSASRGVAASTSTISGDRSTGAETDRAPVRSDFLPAIGDRFTATSDAVVGTFTLTLAAVRDVPPVNTPDDENRFALQFTAVGASPAQAIYRLSCPAVRDATLFIAPVGKGPAHALEAIVNRNS
jgi:hypothetical protein